MWQDMNSQKNGHYKITDLKICDLCGALNLMVNTECHVCRWHGHFDQHVEKITQAIETYQLTGIEEGYDTLHFEMTSVVQPLSSLKSKISNYAHKIYRWFFD